MSQIDYKREIERNVIAGRDRDNTARTPDRFMDNEIGLQIALANMDTSDGKLDVDTVVGFSYGVQKMVDKFDKAGIPLDVITDAKGFERAFYSSQFEPTQLFGDEHTGFYWLTRTEIAERMGARPTVEELLQRGTDLLLAYN